MRAMNVFLFSGNSSIDTWLVNNARAYYDFKTLSSNGYEDRTGNGYNLTGTASPYSFTLANFQYRDVTNSIRNINRVSGNDTPFIPVGNSALFHNDHELHYTFAGRTFNIKHILGTYGGTDARQYNVNINNSGKIVISILGSTYTTTNQIYRGIGSDLRRAINKTYIRIRVDFTNDQLRLWVNGGEVPLTLTSGSGISSMSPTGYSQTLYPFPIGGGNSANNGISTTLYTDSFYFAITDKLSTSDFYNVANYMMS